MNALNVAAQGLLALVRPASEVAADIILTPIGKQYLYRLFLKSKKSLYKMEKLSKEDKEQLLSRIASEKPPTIGLIGVSGVGKSSTINTMFKANLPISHTIACTKEFKEIPLKLSATQGPVKGANIDLVVYDAPGLGEDIKLDPKYLDMYHKTLVECDVILWVMSARNRAVALDQKYLLELKEFHNKMLFGINQVDIVDPMNWQANNLPSKEQRKNIDEIKKDREVKLSETLGEKVKIIPYSNTKGWDLDVLFLELLNTCTTNRKWLFYALQAYKTEDFYPSIEELRAAANKNSTNTKISSSHETELKGNFKSQSKDSLSSTPDNWMMKVMRFFKSNTNLPEEERKILSQVLGRDNFEEAPLTVEELKVLEELIRKQRENLNKSQH